MFSYRFAILTLLIFGFIPATIFLFTHKMPNRRSLWSWDASGWIIVIWLLYGWSIFRYAIAGGRAALGDQFTYQRIASMLFGLAIDTVVWLRLVNWLRFNQHHRPTAARDDDPPVEDHPTDRAG